MAARFPRILFCIVLAVVGIDGVWLKLKHFDVDLPAYLTIAGVSLIFALGGLFYGHIRKDARLSGMLFGTSFMIAFSAAFAVLNYFLLTVAGPRIDNSLAAADRALGVDWPAMMAFAAAHPVLNLILLLAYQSVLPQIAFLILCLGWKARCDEINAFCLALAAGAVLTVTIWTLFPSFGAFSVYDLPAAVQSRLALALDHHYAEALVRLLRDGPGRISPHDAKGLVGFPSFHIALAILITWYARSWKPVCLSLAAINLVVLAATPIQGGHHVVDVLGGIAVAVSAIVFVRWISGLATRHASPVRPSWKRLPQVLKAPVIANGSQPD